MKKGAKAIYFPGRCQSHDSTISKPGSTSGPVNHTEHTHAQFEHSFPYSTHARSGLKSPLALPLITVSVLRYDNMFMVWWSCYGMATERTFIERDRGSVDCMKETCMTWWRWARSSGRSKVCVCGGECNRWLERWTCLSVNKVTAVFSRNVSPKQHAHMHHSRHSPHLITCLLCLFPLLIMHLTSSHGDYHLFLRRLFFMVICC